MKSAKPPSMDAPSNRRSQPVRQTRTNPPRASGQRGSLSGRDALIGVPAPDQPIEIFPAITHFADAITALPKELVRHFTLLKEVDAKIFAPEEGLFQLVDAAMNAAPVEPRPTNDSSSSIALASAPMSAQNSSSGIVLSNNVQPVPSTDGSYTASVFDPGNLPRRQLFRQTAFKIQEMLVSLEEKNHVISAANEALQKQLARVDDVWPHIESEFSDEAKWGSTTHWAYPENRAGKAGQAERSRREGAAAISAAAQQLADEAAARSDARKQAVQAKRNLKTQHQESDFDDPEGRNKPEPGKKGHGAGKVRKTAEVAANVGLGISTNGAVKPNPAPKRRKVEKTPSGPVPTERAMATVFGNTAPKAKTTSPRETPAPEAGAKKRKALPTGTGQSKKSRNGIAAMSPSVASSPVLSAFPDLKVPRASPAPSVARVAATSRARGNSTQSANVENGKPRPSSSASNKPNGAPPGTPDLAPPTSWPRPVVENKVMEKPSLPAKLDTSKKEPVVAEVPEAIGTIVNTTGAKKEITKVEEPERKSEPAPPPVVHTTTITTVTKSGRASKPSTPALATFQEAARSRSARNAEHNNHNNKRKKSNAAAQALAAKLADEDANSSMQGDDEEVEIDADEPTYCYCNSVSYGEMVACDADGCAREWFHLECVGLKVAPKGNAKWYCEDCKERLKAGGKKVNGR